MHDLHFYAAMYVQNAMHSYCICGHSLHISHSNNIVTQRHWNYSHVTCVVIKEITDQDRSVTVALYSPGSHKKETSFLGVL